jgi:hypothetical protein
METADAGGPARGPSAALRSGGSSHRLNACDSDGFTPSRLSARAFYISVVNRFFP